MDRIMKADILACCNDDYCDLSFIIGIIHDYLDLSLNKQKQVLNVISELIYENLILPGEPTDEGGEFDSWKGTNEEKIQRIKKEWDSLGKPPTMWEIVWFDITPKGQEVLKELLKTVKFKDQE